MGRINLFVTLVLVSFFPLTGYLSAALFFLVAGLLWQAEKSSKNLVPPVTFVIVAYLLGYPIVILLPTLYPELWARMAPSNIEYAMRWALRGFSAFALGYVFVGYLCKEIGVSVFLGYALRKGRMNYVLYCLSSIGWLALLSWFCSSMFFGISLVFIEGNVVNSDSGAGTLQQVLTLLSNLRYPFFFGFILLRYSKHANMKLTFLCIGLLIVSIVEIIVIGSKGAIIRMLVVAILALSFLPVKVNLRQIIFGMLALIVIYGSFAVITEYRLIMHKNIRSGNDLFDFSVQAESFGTAFMTSLPFTESATDRQTEVGQKEILSRFSTGMFSFANLLNFTSRHSPYEYAWEGFLLPLYSIVPRFLLPDKPVFFDSGRNAREFYGWSYGGISVTLLGSLYFTWGFTGIITGMAILGGLLAYLVKKVRLAGLSSPHSLILLVVLLVSLLDVGMTFQTILINVFRVALILWLLHLVYPLVHSFNRRQRIGLRTLVRNRRRG